MDAKGRVERAIRYIRENFFAARAFRGIEDLNDQLSRWLVEESDRRPWPDDNTKTVAEVFQEEKLLFLPPSPYEAYEERTVVASKKALIHFDGNRYSVPPEGASKNLALRATEADILIFDGASLLCQHRRSWSKKEKIVNPDHQKAIVKQNQIRSRRSTRNILATELPDIGCQLLKYWADLEENLSASMRKVLGLIDDYGASAVRRAAELAIKQGTPRPESIRYILMQEKEPAFQKKVEIRLRPDIAAIEVGNHDLSTYDNLGESCHD